MGHRALGIGHRAYLTFLRTAVELSSARDSFLPPSEVLVLFQNWMDNPNDVELSVSKLTANSVNRDNISIKDLDPAIELTYYQPSKTWSGFSRNRNRNLIKKDESGRFTFYQ